VDAEAVFGAAETVVREEAVEQVEEVDGQEERVEAAPRGVEEEEMEGYEIAPVPFSFLMFLELQLKQ